MAWITSNAAFLYHSTQIESPIMISSMNISIEDSFSSTPTASVYDCTSGSEVGRYSSPGSKCLWGYWRYVSSHDVTITIPLPCYISASIMVVYSDSAGVVPKVKCTLRKANLTTIVIHVIKMFSFALMRRYAASRSVLPIRIRFEGHLMHMTAIMWIIPRRQNP